MWGQLCLGKSDFDAIENVRLYRYLREALGIKQMPSTSRLRQGFDEDARALIECVDDAAVKFVRYTKALVTSLSTGHVTLYMDVFPMENSDSMWPLYSDAFVAEASTTEESGAGKLHAAGVAR